MMNVHAVLAAKGAIPNVCLSDGMMGRWGRVGCTETFLWRICALTVIEFLENNTDSY